MLNRFSMCSLEHQGYDSLVILARSANNQLQSNLASFNKQFHNVSFASYFDLASTIKNLLLSCFIHQ